MKTVQMAQTVQKSKIQEAFMKTKYLKFAALALVAGMVTPALALEGGADTGGGDAYELVFKDTAQNIKQWIEAGNSEKLILPQDMSHSFYSSSMYKALSKYQINMTNKILKINESEKTCLSKYNNQKSRAEIVCNLERFRQTFEKRDLLYQLVHHEFATVASVEVANFEVSDYSVSSQISSHLKEEVVLRLPIVEMKPPVVYNNLPPSTVDYRPIGRLLTYGTAADRKLMVHLQKLMTESRYSDCTVFKGDGNGKITFRVYRGTYIYLNSWNTPQTPTQISINSTKTKVRYVSQTSFTGGVMDDYYLNPEDLYKKVLSTKDNNRGLIVFDLELTSDGASIAHLEIKNYEQQFISQAADQDGNIQNKAKWLVNIGNVLLGSCNLAF